MKCRQTPRWWKCPGLWLCCMFSLFLLNACTQQDTVLSLPIDPQAATHIMQTVSQLGSQACDDGEPSRSAAIAVASAELYAVASGLPLTPVGKRAAEYTWLQAAYQNSRSPLCKRLGWAASASAIYYLQAAYDTSRPTTQAAILHELGTRFADVPMTMRQQLALRARAIEIENGIGIQ